MAVTRVGQASLPLYPASVYEHQSMPRYFEPSQAQYYYKFGVILSLEGQQTPTNPFCSHTDPFMA